MEHDRNLVFICHANPEDNDVALWLASKLSQSGYEVWSDLTKLFGAEEFWRDIEDAIRNYAAKFVVLISKSSQTKHGVLDEIDIAIKVERAQNITRFVVPIKIDALPFEKLNIGISRKNTIDFSQDWAEGLQALFKVLERDCVPKKAVNNLQDISCWFKKDYANSSKLQTVPQVLISNWISVLNLPNRIHFSRAPISAEKLYKVVSQLPYPSFAYQQLIGSFADSKDLQPGMPQYCILTHGYSIPIDGFIDAQVSQMPALKWQDSHNILSGLLKKAWDKEMEAKGLSPYVLSDHATAWFFPKNLLTTKVKYADADGKMRFKGLMGRSEKWQVDWHYAVSAHPVFGQHRRMVLKPHVIFTQDGGTLIDNKQKMHTLRRRFCRSWWNEQWRGLLLAYLAQLSNGQNDITLNVAPGEVIQLSSIPLRFSSPISIEEPGSTEVSDLAFDESISEDDYEFDDDLDNVIEEDIETSEDKGELPDGCD